MSRSRSGRSAKHAGPRRKHPLKRWRRCPLPACDYCCPRGKRLKVTAQLDKEPANDAR